jgi:hypothetical protein
MPTISIPALSHIYSTAITSEAFSADDLWSTFGYQNYIFISPQTAFLDRVLCVPFLAGIDVTCSRRVQVSICNCLIGITETHHSPKSPVEGSAV